MIIVLLLLLGFQPFVTAQTLLVHLGNVSDSSMIMALTKALNKTKALLLRTASSSAAPGHFLCPIL